MRSYSELADVEPSILQRHVSMLLHDLLHRFEDVSSHGDISTHIDVATLLSQALIHSLRQLLTKHVLDIFLWEKERGGTEM